MRHPATARRPRLIQIQKYAKFGYVSGTRTLRKLNSEVVSRFPALRFNAVSPYRDSRYYGAPKPGKEKQKSYNYCSAILIVHRLRSFLSVFTSVLRKIRREVTRKIAAQFEAWRLRQDSAGQETAGAKEPPIFDAHVVWSRAQLGATRFALAGIRLRWPFVAPRNPR